MYLEPRWIHKKKTEKRESSMYLEARWLDKSTKDGQEDYEHHTQEPICMWGLGLGFRYLYITHTHTGKHCMWPPLWPQPPRSAPTPAVP